MDRENARCHAVIFDMDGILIDSEPFWQTAEREVFATVGLHLTPEDMARTIGLRIEEVVAFWYRRFPWQGPSFEQVASDIVHRVIDLVHAGGRLLPGVHRALESLRARDVPMAVASSASRDLIDAVVEGFDLGVFFRVVCSADQETHGKPHPAVFLAASSALGVAPPVCLVIEDSVNGVLAAKAARMRCLAVPDPRQRDDPRFVIADEVFGSLEELDDAVWDRWVRLGDDSRTVFP